MLHRLTPLWMEEDGVLSFEWVVLTTLLTLGIVAGLTAARDAIVDELGDAAQAMLALDNSYTIDWPLELEVDVDGAGGNPGEVAGLASDSSFIDAFAFTDCARTTLDAAAQQSPAIVDDTDS
jgi:Flp pilus assembly pilin Flp